MHDLDAYSIMTSAGELVHSDSAVFQYDVIKVNLGLDKPRSKQALNVPLYPEQPVPARPELPSERNNGDAELDFLAFSAPAAPVEVGCEAPLCGSSLPDAGVSPATHLPGKKYRRTPSLPAPSVGLPPPSQPLSPWRSLSH